LLLVLSTKNANTLLINSQLDVSLACLLAGLLASNGNNIHIARKATKFLISRLLGEFC